MHAPRSLWTPLPLLLLGVFACGGDPEPPASTGPKITEFSADPIMVAKNGTTTLKYAVTGATKIKIDTADGLSVFPETGQLSGTVVTPALTQTTTFVLSAANAAGTPVSREVTVTVTDVAGVPTVMTFGPNPATINPGESSVLSWTTLNATSGRIEGGGTVVYSIPSAQLAAGSFAVMPTVTTAYTLVVANDAAQEARGMATVTVNLVNQPVIASFTATPDPIDPGQSSTLAWNVAGATGITITDGAGAVVYTGANLTGTQAVMPTVTTVYTLTATGNGQTATGNATVNVNVPTTAVVVGFAATPDTIQLGQSSSLSWQVLNAPGGISISDGAGVVTTSTQLTGSFVVMPTVNTTYTLTAINTAGDAMSTATVTVIQGNGAQVVSFTATPTNVSAGGSASLDWSVSNAPGGISISDGVNTLTTSAQATGSFSVTPAATTTYTLTAINTAGNATATVTVTVTNPNGAQIVSFTATPTNITAGGSASLAWSVTNAPGGISISDGVNTVTTSAQATGTFSVTPAATTTYVLTAINATDGNATANVTVTVGNVTGATVVSFTATPTNVTAGGSASLAWSVTNAPGGISISDGVNTVTTSAQATGTFSVTPAATTTYVLTAINAAGGNATSNVTVTVTNPGAAVVNSFTATPTTLTLGATSVLAWNVSNAPGGVTITANAQTITGSGQVIGTSRVAPNATTTYTLTAVNAAGGNATANVTVTVNGAPGTETEPNNTQATANSLAPGAVVNGTLPAGDIDWFAVTVPNGGNIRASTSNGAGGCTSDTVVAIYDAAFAQIAIDDDGGITPCSLIDPQLDARASDLAAGTYYIAVVLFDAAATGSYQLQVAVGSPGCGNGVVESRGTTAELCDDGGSAAGDGCSATCQLEINGNTISAPGGTVTVNLGQPGSLAVVPVTIAAGQTITAVAADPGGATCNNADTGINLGDSNFLLLGQKLDGGPGACATVVDPEDPANGRFGDLPAGTYYLVVFNQTGTAATGPVQLTVTIRNAACGNNQVEVNGGEQCDNAPGVGLLPCTACQITPTGTITLPAGAPVVSSGDFAADDFDLFRLVLTQSANINAETFAPTQVGGCATADTTLMILTDDFEQIAFDDDTGINACAQIASNRPSARLAAGSYWVLVTEANGLALPAYQLVMSSTPVAGNAPPTELEPNDSQATATSLGLTGPGTRAVQGVISGGGDDDVYSFTIAAGANRTVSARTYDLLGMPTSCPVDTVAFDTRIFVEAPGIETTGPNTGELAFNDDLDDLSGIYCSELVAVPVTGGLQTTTYYVRVQGYNDLGPREYFLDITVQ